jgi:hypothetical protein
VCNHLSLFLCVADYDKLLPGERSGGRRADVCCQGVGAAARGTEQGLCTPPARLTPRLCVHGTIAGWSHFAQFTIAVVNQDPKKSKYSGAR